MWTLSQLPAISAPAFVSPRGLPFGLQLVARRYNDPLLLSFVAEAVQRGHLPASSYGIAYGKAAASEAAAKIADLTTAKQAVSA